MLLGESLLYLIGGIGLGLLFGFLFAKIFFYTRIQKHRKSAVKQSKATTLGYVNEKIAPVLPNFPYEYKDMTFIGKGIDYLVFDGLSEGYVHDIILLEIKSGKSRLNKNEKLIEDAVKRGRVKYKVMRVNV